MSNLTSDNKSKLLFNEDDVNAATHQLTRCLRRLFFEKGVTEEMFNDKFNAYFHNLGPDDRFWYNRTLEIRNIVMANSFLTFKTFELLIRVVLECKVTKVDVELMDVL